jgi:DnaJ-class molecular chaperone
MTIYSQEESFGAPDVDGPGEVVCKRCYGTGEDRDGADCVHCDGNGTLLI